MNILIDLNVVLDVILQRRRKGRRKGGRRKGVRILFCLHPGEEKVSGSFFVYILSLPRPAARA
jgi:hypothetical protein